LLKNSTARLIPDSAALRRYGSRSFLGSAIAVGITLLNRGQGSLHRFAASGVVLLLALFLSTFTLAETGAETYKAHCSACHGAHGLGDTMIGRNLKLRALGSDEVQKQSDEELLTIISKGRGKDRMPAFDHRLSKEQIRGVLDYVRSLKK
jgi:mono/diheme cytochrome c family protein